MPATSTNEPITTQWMEHPPQCKWIIFTEHKMYGRLTSHKCGFSREIEILELLSRIQPVSNLVNCFRIKRPIANLIFRATLYSTISNVHFNCYRSIICSSLGTLVKQANNCVMTTTDNQSTNNKIIFRLVYLVPHKGNITTILFFHSNVLQQRLYTHNLQSDSKKAATSISYRQFMLCLQPLS